MTQPVCDRETMVMRAALCGRWEVELRRHVAGCSHCSDTAAAASALKELQQVDSSSAALPSAAQMWWKLQLRARREAMERAARPVLLVQSITLLLALLSFAGACAWQWHTLVLNALPLREFALHFWESWGLLLLGGTGAAALFVTMTVLLAHPED